MRRPAQVEGGSERSASSINARGRGRGRVGVAVVSRGSVDVGRDLNRGGGLGDSNITTAAGIFVVGATAK